ncbi:MAG: efflux RND transporter periplasmic adaptor subunit [Chthoniobacterales bacterium]|nr:efflux RND transporter periplasmic adaptor subunit [Chthoniobacterales bacterium]
MKRTINIILVIALAFIASCSKPPPPKPAGIDYYTCTMHPSVHAEAPGKCPICGMELVPVMKTSGGEMQSMSGMQGMPGMQDGETKGAGEKPREFVVPVERQQQIGVTYATVERKRLEKEVRAVGTVEADLQKHWAFVARVDGYVQQLFVASAGEVVEKDEPLLSIYSPDLATTEREFVMLLRMRDEARTPEMRATPERLIAAARTRLQQWNVTPEQIAELEKTRTPNETITLRSPFRGIVQELPAHQGVAVKTGDHLVDIADLSTVWVWADFYESELGALETGQNVAVTANSFPGDNFNGAIAVVNPFLNATSRISKVRIDINNPDFKLRPGMFANIVLAVVGGEQLAIPVSAIMPTGRRNIAFVDKGNGKLEPREVKLGKQFGDFYAVESGLAEGERIVASANFLIDAEAQVQGALADFNKH